MGKAVAIGVPTTRQRAQHLFDERLNLIAVGSRHDLWQPLANFEDFHTAVLVDQIPKFIHQLGPQQRNVFKAVHVRKEIVHLVVAF